MTEAPTDIAQNGLRGVRRGSCDVFLGVPYAAPPVGRHRWASPAPPTSPSEGRDADAFGLAAPQPERMIAHALHGSTPPTGEDCLTLNLWLPSAATRPLPLMVWIHGGGWTMGFSSQLGLSGEVLATEAGIAVATINYRLGSLGWLHHPALASERGEPSANWGLLDQIAALRWLAENAALLGLDPERITVAGQSAGALSVLNLLVSPQAAGLFSRAIVQSAPLGEAAAEPETAIRWAEDLARKLGLDDFDPDALRAVSAADVVDAHEALLKEERWRGGRGAAVPTLEPVTLPVKILEAATAAPEVEVLIGHTTREGTFRLLGDPTLELDPTTVENATRSRFAEPIARWSGERAAVGSRVYGYRVDVPALDPRLGATHGVDAPLVFGTYGSDPAFRALVGDSESVATASRAVRAAWAGFVRDGDPGWAPLSTGDDFAEAGAVFSGEGRR